MTPFIQFAEQNFKVLHLAKGLIPFEAHDFNINLSKIIDQERFVLVKKYRQAGFSTFVILWSLYECMYKAGQHILIVCKTDRDTVDTLYRPLRTALLHMPDELHPKFIRLNQDTIELKNGSVIYLRCPQASRGCCVNATIMDEFAFWGDREDYYAAVLPTVSTGGKLIIGSSTNGKKNRFYKLWSDYNNYFRYAPWWGNHPDFPIERATELKEILGEKGWRAEYECEFLD